MSPEALARLHAAAFAQDRPWTANEFAALIALPGTLLLSDDHSALLGRVIADEAEVLTFATHPGHRREGRAASLLDRFEAEARARGAVHIFLDVAEDNLPARALYEGRGFREVGRRRAYYARDAGAVAALVLARPL